MNTAAKELKREIKSECLHLTRKVWIALLICVTLIVFWGLALRKAYSYSKEAQRVANR